MGFVIKMGVPDMLEFWNDLKNKHKDGISTKDEEILYSKLCKLLKLLADNPMHPSLKSHEIDDLSRRYGFKVWQSYLENNVSKARRVFWVYGPDQGEITILGVENHPENKRGAYKRIILSKLKP